MSRHLLVAAAVLLPFAGLVALGFSLMTDPLPIVLPAPLVRVDPPAPPPPPPRPLAPPPRPVPPPLPVTVQVVAPPAPPVPSKPPPELSAQAKRLPILASVEPLVQQCFKDLGEQVREPLRVTVAFNTTVDGGFQNVVLKKTSSQDPNLAACILDAFEDAHFEPSGVALRRQSFTFTFPGPDGGL